MRSTQRIQKIFFLCACLCLPSINSFGQSEIIKIWPDTPPNETKEFEEEYDTTKPGDNLVAGKRVQRIINVTSPELHYYPAPKEKANGTSVIIYPGGGYYILAWDLEGTEVAQWLNSIGISAYILKYRVPRRDDEKPWFHALQDAQRSISIVRSRASESNDHNPNRIGVLGFSAGGNLAFLSACYKDDRIYTPVDNTDHFDSRPNFGILIYPAWIHEEDTLGLKPFYKVDGDTAPMIFIHTSDDRVSSLSSIAGYTALKKAGVPAGIHIYPEGGHGYGLRRTSLPVTTWPDRVEDWLGTLGLTTRKVSYIESFGDDLFQAIKERKEIPLLARETYQPVMMDAYAIQSEFVKNLVDHGGKQIAGYKGAVAGKAAQERLGLKNPASAVLFKSGFINGDKKVHLSLSDHINLKIETEMGYIFKKNITSKIRSVNDLRKHIKSVVPVIELPGGYASTGKNTSFKDVVARNFGSYKFIVGEEVLNHSVIPDQVNLSLTRDGELINSASGNDAKDGQWRNLLYQVNHAIGQGHLIKEDHLIITGALGKIIPAQPGDYLADYGPLGKIQFRITE